MVSTADASGQLNRRSAASGRWSFENSQVAFGHFGPAFGAGTTPKYQAVLGPDPLAIFMVVYSQISGHYSPDTACNYHTIGIRFTVELVLRRDASNTRALS